MAPLLWHCHIDNQKFAFYPTHTYNPYMSIFTTAEIRFLQEPLPPSVRAPMRIPPEITKTKNNAIVYCLKFQDNSIYIGSTSDPINRYRQHNTPGCESFKFTVLYVGDLKNARRLEQLTIKIAQRTRIVRNKRLYVMREQNAKHHCDGAAARLRVLHEKGLSCESYWMVRRRMQHGETFEQAVKQRAPHRTPPVHVVTFEGKQIGVHALAKQLGMPYQTILDRMYRQKMPIEQAAVPTLRPHRRKNGWRIGP